LDAGLSVPGAHSPARDEQQELGAPTIITAKRIADALETPLGRLVRDL
jgi:hypothetical protein